MSNSLLNDIGTEIYVETGVNLSTALVKQIKIKKPGGTLMTKAATVSGTTKLLYITISGDLDENGLYTVQAYLEFSGGWKGHGSPAYFTVDSLSVS